MKPTYREGLLWSGFKHLPALTSLAEERDKTLMKRRLLYVAALVFLAAAGLWAALLPVGRRQSVPGFRYQPDPPARVDRLMRHEAGPPDDVLGDLGEAGTRG